MKPRVLVTKRIYPEAIEYLKEHCEVDYEETDDGLPSDQLLPRLRGKQAILANLTNKFTGEFIDSLDGLKIIANVAVGFDNIDVPAATRKGILVTNTPDVLTDTTADFAFALLLAAARRVVEGHQFLHSGKWQKWAIDLLVGQDVHHRTLGILGMGRIGQAMARRARGFSMRVLYHDPVPAPEAIARELELELVCEGPASARIRFRELACSACGFDAQADRRTGAKLMKKIGDPGEHLARAGGG